MRNARSLARLLALTGILGLVLAGCAKSPQTTDDPSNSDRIVVGVPSGKAQAEPGSPASATSTAPTGPIKIGFLVKQPEEPWFQQEWKWAEKAAAEKGFELLKKQGQDGEKVLNEISNLATAGAQGFIICTPDQKLGPAIVERAKEANLKVMSVDDRFVGADGQFMADVPHMGISARKIGEMVGQACWDEFAKRGWDANETGCAAITFTSLETSKERTEGAKDALTEAGFPAEKVFEMEEKTTDVQGSMNAMNILLTQHPEVRRWLIYSMNDEGVLGAVRATEGAGFSAEDTIGVGIGGTTAVAEFRQPKPTGFFASVLIDPYRHGYETSVLMYEWIRDGKQPPMETYTEGTLVFRDTCEQVMKERGLLDE